MVVAKPSLKAAPKAPPKPEESWLTARLIPTTGIGGQDEQEQRATSSLLAVMKAVPQFGKAVLVHAGAPIGRISTFTEIRFVNEDTKLSIPDGAIVVEWGKKRWVCLVEVKTAGAELRADQVTRYVDLARTSGFDAVLTISNQITASPTEVPVAVDARRLKKVALRHLSWWQVMTVARVEHKHRGISDPDQAWILGELIAYLDHEKAGAGGFEDLGEKWVAVREGARTRSVPQTPACAMWRSAGSSSSSTWRSASRKTSGAKSRPPGRRSWIRRLASMPEFVASLTTAS